MKKLFWFLLLFTVCAYTAVTWDYYLSKNLFEKYCSDGRVGSEIYETIELGDEYFLPLSKEKLDTRRLDIRFILSDGRVIDEKKFSQDFTVSPPQYETLNSIGPIMSMETLVTRNIDSKILGKAVSLSNALGWWIYSSKFGPKGDYCPSGRDSKNMPNYYKAHQDLIRKIFVEKPTDGDTK
jgi:hypothetical protein